MEDIRIMIVEDESMVAMDIKWMLENTGITSWQPSIPGKRLLKRRKILPQILFQWTFICIGQKPISIEKQSLHITASFGVANILDDTSNLNNLTHWADKSFYMAKFNGRNRVEVWDHGNGSEQPNLNSSDNEMGIWLMPSKEYLSSKQKAEPLDCDPAFSYAFGHQRHLVRFPTFLAPRVKLGGACFQTETPKGLSLQQGADGLRHRMQDQVTRGGACIQRTA